MKTMMSETLDSVNAMEKYDAAGKMLLSQKVILARILKHCIPEFQYYSADEIADKFIETDANDKDGETMPVIRGMNPENVNVEEGAIFGDVRFWVSTPQGEKWIIDVEAQRKFHPDYSLSKRGTYYLGRMISAQKGTEFKNSHYEDLKKTFVIWVCLEPPMEWRNVITGYDVYEHNIEGKGRLDPKEYELMSQIMIGLGDHEDEAAVGVLRLLDVIISQRLALNEKKEIMSSEFGIAMTEELEEEVKEMCNFSEAIWERAMTEGRAKGIEQGEERMSTLNDYLLRDDRMEDMIRAIKDKIFRHELYLEYGIVLSN